MSATNTNKRRAVDTRAHAGPAHVHATGAPLERVWQTLEMDASSTEQTKRMFHLLDTNGDGVVSQASDAVQ